MSKGSKAKDAKSDRQAIQARQRQNRKARLQAEEEARQQEAARERKQQTLIGIIVTVVVVALIAAGGFIYWNSHRPVKKENTYEAVQKVKVKPSVANDKGGILVSKAGVGKSVEKAPTMEIYMDFMCPGCGALHRGLDSTLTPMVKAGQINLVLYPMSFMDRLTTDQYSARAGSAAVYIAQNDPDHFLPFVASLYEKDFQPDEENYKPVSDKRIRQQAIKAGISPAMADRALKGQYKAWLSALNEYTPTRKELWHTSGQNKGQMSTPTVRINGTFWDLGKLSTARLDYKAGLLKALGLDPEQVGREGAMPSIGSKGSPLAL